MVIITNMNYILRTFIYLCMDLDMRYRLTEVSQVDLLIVRTALLNAVELRTTSSWEDLIERLKPLFHLEKWDLGLATSCGTPANIKFVRAVYYISSFLLKVEKEVDDNSITRYVQKFKETEAEVATERWRSARLLDSVGYYINRLFSRLSLDHASCSSHYRDGPGAVYERLDSVVKKTMFKTYRTLDYYYPIDEHWYDCFCSDFFGTEASTPLISCRLTLVPKDFKGPRGVFIHPRLVMRTQQGQRVPIERILKHHASVRLADQSFNQEYAHIGSYNRMYATLDLSDASDRIGRSLIARLFRLTHWKHLAATRATLCELPDGASHKLQMFAPMGSALCFPIQTALFVSIAICSIYYSRTGSLILSDEGLVSEIERSVRVFGDDIIIPNDTYGSVIEDLESFGLKVNRSKSFSAGFFRESCGYDAYHGVEITPPRLRINLNRRDLGPNDFSSLVSFHNRLRCKFGLLRTAEYIGSLVREKWPQVGSSPNIGEFPTALYCDGIDQRRLNWSNPMRFSPDHHVESKVLTVATCSARAELEDRYLLNDWFFSRKTTEPVETNRYCQPRLIFRRRWQALGE